MGTVSNVKEYFDTLDQRFVAAQSKGVNATYLFDLAGDGGGQWHIVVSDGTMKVGEGPVDGASCTIKMSAADYVKLVNGQLNGMMAVMKGQMKVAGNVMLAKKMQDMFPISK